MVRAQRCNSATAQQNVFTSLLFNSHCNYEPIQYFYHIKFKDMNQEVIRKDAIVNLRLTSEEKQAAFQAAKQAGKPVSEMIRELIKNVKPANQA